MSDVQISLKRKGSLGDGSIQFLVDGQLEDHQRFVAICQAVQTEKMEEIADSVVTMTRRSSENMTMLVSAVQDLTNAVSGLRGDLSKLSNESIAVQVEKQIERSMVVASGTLNAIRGS